MQSALFDYIYKYIYILLAFYYLYRFTNLIIIFIFSRQNKAVIQYSFLRYEQS